MSSFLTCSTPSNNHLKPPFWIGSFYQKELNEYLNPRTVSDDFHEEIGNEELREEVDDEEALENGNKGDQEAIVVEIIICIYFTVWAY